jgi:tellurite resistance protein
VAGIVISDDILDAKEEAFVDRLIASFDVGGTGRDAIFPLVDRDEAAAQIKELPEQAQDEAMRLLIEAACIDGQIAPEEQDYLIAVGAALGLSEATLGKRVADWIAKGRE